jgi:hypothetical protein
MISALPGNSISCPVAVTNFATEGFGVGVGGGVGVGVGSVGSGADASLSFAPHSEQNLLSAGLDTPHLGHFISSAGAGGATGCSGCGCGATSAGAGGAIGCTGCGCGATSSSAKLAPQSSQNKDPSGFSFPQEGFGHFIMIHSSFLGSFD